MVKIIFTAILFVFSELVDIWCYFKISKIKAKKSQIALILILDAAVGLLLNSSIFGIILANVLEIILFVLIFIRNGKFELILGSILYIVIFDLINDIVFGIIENLINLHSFVSQLILRVMLILLIIGLVKVFDKRLHNYLVNQNRKIFLGILIYLYISSLSISAVYLYTRTITPLFLIFTLYILIQVVFAVFVYHEIIMMQTKILERKEQEKIKQRQRQLEEYAEYLEKSEDELRAFKHDYKNILSSLKVSAQEGNAQEVVEKLDKYTETNLNSKALLKYKDVNHIHIRSVKSIIIAKLTEMYNLNIPYNFECRESIRKIPDHVNELDLVRIIGITMDNAIEESMSLINEGHNAVSAEVQIMMYSDSPDNFEYEIKNKIGNKKISTNQIQKSGYTTKKNHKGLGLANIKKIEDEYPDMAISYSIQNNFFDFYMSIDTEDGEE